METETAIRCMRHCNNEYNIFYSTFPEFCPICKVKLKDSFLALPPFCVPHPFFSSSQAACSVVVRPTEGCFLKTYQSGNDLHIGITSSQGWVYNYDETGVHIDNVWSMCIAVDIPSLSKQSSSIFENWDKMLDEQSMKLSWSFDKYHPRLHNCYDFVLSFLKTVSPDCQHFMDKDTFSQSNILPRTTKAAKYIELYRNVLDNGFVVGKVS